MKKTDMQIDGKRAHEIGEAIRKGIEEMTGTEISEGKETRWMKRGMMMITRGEIERKTMKGRGTRKDTEIRRKRGIEIDEMRRTGTKRGMKETRKEGENNGRESTGLRGRDRDTRNVEKEKEIGWKSTKERRESGTERGSGTKMNMKTEKDERDMETERRKEVRC